MSTFAMYVSVVTFLFALAALADYSYRLGRFYVRRLRVRRDLTRFSRQ